MFASNAARDKGRRNRLRLPVETFPMHRDLFLPEREGEAGPLGRRLRRFGPAQRAQSIADLRAMALARIPRFCAEYLEGGADDEVTLAGNRRAFDRFSLRARVLRDLSTRSLERPVLGDTWRLPFAIGPTGFNGLLWPQGDLALARAAAAAGIPFTQSTVSNATIAEVAAAAGRSHWYQLYVYGPDHIWQELLARAAGAGCRTLVVTVDTPLIGNRERDRRSYARPGVLGLSRRLDALRHPRWLWRVLLRHGYPHFPEIETFLPQSSRNHAEAARWCAANVRLDLDWRLLQAIRRNWAGRLLVKGIQHPQDVGLAVDAGADGIVLSNHGGRQLDRAVAPLDLVREARALAGPPFTILVDSGFRRGLDILLALALGADGVLLGRAMLYGLAAGGEGGVSRAIEILATELDRSMALLGVTSLDELTPDLVGAVPATSSE